MNKVDAPVLLLEDFNYFFNKAVYQYINKRYNIYDTNQQTTDDIRVLKSTATLTPKPTYPEGAEDDSDAAIMNSLYGATFEVDLPTDYLHILNCICIYKVKGRVKCYNKDSYQPFSAYRLTSDAWPVVINNLYQKPSYKRPYYYIHNVNVNETIPTNPHGDPEFDSVTGKTQHPLGTGTDAIERTPEFEQQRQQYEQEIAQYNEDYQQYLQDLAVYQSDLEKFQRRLTKFKQDITNYLKGKDVSVDNDKYYYYAAIPLLNPKATYIEAYYDVANENTVIAVKDFYHNAFRGDYIPEWGLKSNYDSQDFYYVPKQLEGYEKQYAPTTAPIEPPRPDKPILATLPRKISLTNDISYSLIEKEEGVRYGNTSPVRMEIRYGNDTKTFELVKVQIDYIKTPQYIRLTPEQLDTVEDTSQMLEFPDYVCQEIINELVHIVMENSGDQRLQTHPVVSQSIVSPTQQQTA